ncbi:MAG: META domain-containing protein [Bacteroidales bacterium]|nr:META domain-containing protein [Bacteroidales bacterium]MDD4669599.1 META domain-containing protein [Bacteroidales bacterium]
MKKIILLFISCIMLISSCNSVSTSLTDLESSTWKLLELNGIKDSTFTVSSFFTMDFKEGNSLFGIGVCNSFFGKYEAGENGAITIDMKGSTMAMCPENNLEQSLSIVLSNIDSFKIKKNKLYLYEGNNNTAIFEKFVKQ